MTDAKINKNSKSELEDIIGEWTTRSKQLERSEQNVQHKIVKYVNNVKKEMQFFNYGLPPDPIYIDIGWEDVRKQFVALKELWIRLNVFEANGQSRQGMIQYPEANRIIDYNLDGESINRSYIRFISTRNSV